MEGTYGGRIVRKKVFGENGLQWNHDGKSDGSAQGPGTDQKEKVENPEHEIERVQGAVDASKQQLATLYDKAVKEVGESSAAIFEVHQMMLEDEDYLDAISHVIRTEMVNAEYAVAITGDNFAAMFAGMEDEYMQARAADVKDISARVVRNLSGQGGVDFSAMEPSVIVADDLSPSETVQMDKKKILAFVTVHGSTNSHTAILARMMSIPALIGVGIDLDAIRTGMTAIVDGAAGEVIFEPTQSQCGEAEKKIQNEREKLRLLQGVKGQEERDQRRQDDQYLREHRECQRCGLRTGK